MPDVPVTLTPWFDAKDNPPAKGKAQGRAVIVGRARRGGISGIEWCDEDGAYQWPKDTVAWSELPSPPDMSDPLGPLTANDLRYALQSGIADAEDDALIFHVSDPNGDGEQVFARRTARLRRALDQISTTENT